jgi:hypothetical protein
MLLQPFKGVGILLDQLYGQPADGVFCRKGRVGGG